MLRRLLGALALLSLLAGMSYPAGSQIFGVGTAMATAAPTPTPNPTPTITPTPSPPPTTAPTPYSATVLADTPCAYYRLNDVPATPDFSSAMFDASVNANQGSYAPAVVQALVIVNNDNSPNSMYVPGGTWVNTQQAWGPANITAQKPTSAVQLEMWTAPALIGAQAIVDRGGITGTSGIPTRLQSFTYTTASTSGETSATVPLGFSGTAATLILPGNHLVARIITSDNTTGGTVTLPATWTRPSGAQQHSGSVAQDVMDLVIPSPIPASVTFNFSTTLVAGIVIDEVSGTSGVDVVTKATATVTTPFTTTTGTGTQTGLNDLGLVFVGANDAVLTPADITGYTTELKNSNRGNGGSVFAFSGGFYSSDALITAASVPAQSTTWADGSGSEPVLGEQVLMMPSGTAGSGSPYRLGMDSGGHFTFSVNLGGTVQTVTSTTVASALTIYHVVGTYTGASMYITVNNSKEGTAAQSGTVSGYDTMSGIAIGGLYNNDNATAQYKGYLAAVALYGAGVTGCNAGVISDARITGHYNRGTGATAPTSPAPTAPPTPPPCATTPPLTNGQEVPIGFVPFNCTTSPWNHALTIPAGGHPTYAPYESVIQTQFANANVFPVRSEEPGANDNAYSVVYAQDSDPLINVTCGGANCNTVDNGGFCAITAGGVCRMHIPAQARFAPSTSGADSVLSVIQCGASIASCQNGTEIDLYVLSPGNSAPKGSLANGNWQTGDTMNLTPLSGGAVNCGNWSTGTGITTTFGVTAGGNCVTSGQLKANELLAGVINHPLKLVLNCQSSAATVYPAFANTPSGANCTGGVNAGPPIGALLWYDVPCVTTRASLTLQTWEKGILCALNEYGAFLMDNVNGGTFAQGMFYLPSGGEMFFAFGMNSPYAALTAQGWNASNPPGSLGPRYTGADPWNPTGFTAAYWQARMHYLHTCEAHNPRTC